MHKLADKIGHRPVPVLNAGEKTTCHPYEVYVCDLRDMLFPYDPKENMSKLKEPRLRVRSPRFTTMVANARKLLDAETRMGIRDPITEPFWDAFDQCAAPNSRRERPATDNSVRRTGLSG
jgi:hypothetical protein